MNKHCVQCKNPLSEDYPKSRCIGCLDYQKKYQQKLRDKNPPKMCVVCNQNSPKKNSKICKDCFKPVPNNNARLNLIAAQLCIDCREPNDGITFRCKNCSLKQKERDREIRLKLLSNNICPTCKKNSIDLELHVRMCRECRNKINKKNTQLRESRLKAGLCRICGKEPSKKKTACEICLLKNMAKRYLSDKNKWVELKKVFEQQNRRCAYTNIPLTIGINASIDHIVAKSKGGENTIENFQWVHLWVNKMKHDLSHDEFMTLLKDFIQQSHAALFDSSKSSGS